MSQDMLEQQEEQAQIQQAPLATRMRPNSLNAFVGQEHLIGKGRVLRRAIETDRIPSMIFWGPPGSGKTTLARIIAGLTKSFFVPASAVNTGVPEVRRIIEESLWRKKTIFSHRFGKLNKIKAISLLRTKSRPGWSGFF